MLRALRRMITFEWPLKLLSMVVAAALWVYVINERDPLIIKAVRAEVRTVNVPEGLVVLSTNPSTVEVKLRGRRSALENAGKLVRVQGDLSGLSVGTHEVPVTVTRYPPGTEVVGGGEAYVQVKLDRETKARRPVIVEVRGLPAEGFQARAATAEPGTVEIRGAASLLKRVAKVAATIDISGMSASVHQVVPVEARDEANLVVEGIEIDPPQVTVDVPITRVNVKTVPVWPRLSDPAPGFRVAAVAVRPPTVVVGGAPPRLARLATIRTETLDISALTGTGTYNARLELPSGVRVLGPASVPGHNTRGQPAYRRRSR